MQIFQLSDYFKLLVPKLRFATIVISRFFKILIRRNKRIELIRLEYSHKYLFKKSFLVVRYRFRNALWYNFYPITRTTEKEVTVINLLPVKSSKITLYVRGFFRCEKYLLDVRPEYYLNSHGFETQIANIKGPVDFPPSIDISIKQPNIRISEITVKTADTTVVHNPYIQSDFI